MDEKNKTEENEQGHKVDDEYFPLWTRANYPDSGILLLNRTMHELNKVCSMFSDYRLLVTAGYRVSADGLSLSPYIELRGNADYPYADIGSYREFFITLTSDYIKRFCIGEMEFLQDSKSFQITARMDGSVEGMRNPENELLGFAVNELYVRKAWRDTPDFEPSDYYLPHETTICPICHQTNKEEDKLFSLCWDIVDGTATSIEICGYRDFECKGCSANRNRSTGFNQFINICYPCFVEIYTNWRRKQLGVEAPLAQDRAFDSLREQGSQEL